MNLKSVLKPDQSVVAGIATVGVVYGIYSASVGSVSQAHASTPNHPSLESSRKKAGYTALALVSALGLITKDGNIVVLGYATIGAMEVWYRHAIMADPATGSMVPPVADPYSPAGNVVPFSAEMAS